MKYRIQHREELVGYFEVEADDEAIAMDIYEKMVKDGELDYGDMEMVNSWDNLVREGFEVGQECHYVGDMDKKDKYFILTYIYDDGGTYKLFEAIRPDGSVMANRRLDPDLIYRTGRYFPIMEFLNRGTMGGTYEYSE